MSSDSPKKFATKSFPFRVIAMPRGCFPALSVRSTFPASTSTCVTSFDAQFAVNSRATPYLTLTARYRFNDHNNNTPHFDGREYVRFDGVPEELADDPLTPHVEGLSEYFQITRQNFDGSGTFHMREYGSLKIGYANEQFDREGRGFSDVSENIFRVAYDANLFERAKTLAPRWEAAIHSLRGLPHVIDLRNLGLMGAIELEPRAGAPGARAFELFVDCFQRGALVRVTGDVVALSPPLIIAEQEVDRLFEIIADGLRRLA